MINKATKNALYANILFEISDLLLSLENEQKTKLEEVNDNAYKSTVLSYQRIKNNAIIMLLKNGIRFYTTDKDWKKAKELNLNINSKTFSIDLQSVKTALSNETDKILDKVFSEKEFENVIDLKLIQKLDMEKYKNQTTENDKKENLTLKNKEIKSEKTSDKNNLPNIQKKTDETSNKMSKKVEQEKIVVLEDKYNTNDSKLKPTNVNTKKVENKKEQKEIEPEILSIESDPMDELKEEIHIKEDDIQKNIMVKDLVMDIYTIKFSDKNEENTEDKIYTIIVAPTAISKNDENLFIPTFSYAKIGRNICTCSSPNKMRSSYQIQLEDEIFIVRGKWSNIEGFSSLLYPQNTNNKKVSIQKKQIKPNTTKTIGHNIEKLSDQYNVHILPLSSKNGTNGKVGIVACLEDKKEDKFIAISTKERSYVDIPYKKNIYRVSAYWDERKLISNVQIV